MTTRSKATSGPRRNVFNQLEIQKNKRNLIRDSILPNEQRDEAFRRIILSIPPGRVSTYGRVAAAAGYPRYHRAVARLLRVDPIDSLPWHRVLGAGGSQALGDSPMTLKAAEDFRVFAGL